MNTARADAGCQPVTDDPELTAYAQQWAEQQADDKLMRHSDGPYAENVAMGYATAAEVMAGWMGSSGHRGNILNCDWTRTGIGSAVGDDGLTYWTQVFGI